MSMQPTPADHPDSFSTGAQERMAEALRSLEEAGVTEGPDVIRLQAESELGDEELDRALLGLYLAGMVSYTSEAGSLGRLATAILGDESAYRLTPYGRAALANEVADDVMGAPDAHNHPPEKADRTPDARPRTQHRSLRGKEHESFSASSSRSSNAANRNGSGPDAGVVALTISCSP